MTITIPLFLVSIICMILCAVCGGVFVFGAASSKDWMVLFSIGILILVVIFHNKMVYA